MVREIRTYQNIEILLSLEKWEFWEFHKSLYDFLIWRGASLRTVTKFSEKFAASFGRFYAEDCTVASSKH
jgi:hypothetical protein